MKKQVLILTIMMLTMMPSMAWAGVMADVFGKEGVGFSLVMLLAVSSFGAIFYYIISALGMGQVAGFVKVVTTFSCIGIVIDVIWEVISNVCKLFGVAL